MARRFKPLAVLAAQAADDKGGEKIELVHLKGVTSLADYLLIVSVDSPAQMEAMENKISSVLEENRISLLHHEGSKSGLWKVLDYGGLLIHLMHPEARNFYALDKLYRDAPKVHWKNSSHPKKHAAHR
ncbi:MAG: ribosome silencing factor [Elusimicrobia bacterium]|nr:ribosome silencing factor [Elusimicrobiota bacterium]